MPATFDTRGLPSLWAAALMRHQELIAEVQAARRARLLDRPRAPRRGGGVRGPLGALLVRAGEALQGEPRCAARPAAAAVATNVTTVRAGYRCPLCRRPTWSQPLGPDDAPRAIAAAEDLIREHQRRRSC